MADLFSQLPLSYLPRGANISGGHCTYGPWDEEK